jgi:hypothetical protein
MEISAESIEDRDLLGDEAADPVVEMGTIGWEGEGGNHFELGTADNGGVSLVQVQLYRGRDNADDSPVPRKPERAQGHKIWARISGEGSFWLIPKKGKQCYVAFPHGYGDGPGMGVIIAVPGANPTIQFSDERAVLDVGDDVDLIIKARRISLQTHSGHFISLTDDAGIQIIDKVGDGVNIDDGKVMAFASQGGDAKALLMLTGDEANLMHKGGSFISCAGANSTWMGTELNMAGATMAFGTAASPATPILIGLSGMAGVPSTCMKGTP